MFLKFYLEKTMVEKNLREKKKFNIKRFFRSVSATVCRVSPGKFFFSSIVRSSFNNATQIDGISGKKFAGNEMKNAEGDRKSGSKRLVQKKSKDSRQDLPGNSRRHVGMHSRMQSATEFSGSSKSPFAYGFLVK